MYDAHLFPGLLFSLQPDYLLTYRVHPRAVDRTEILADTFVHAACPDGLDLADVLDFWDQVNAEDRAICEQQQLGVRLARLRPDRVRRRGGRRPRLRPLVARRYASALPADEEDEEDESDEEEDAPPSPPPEPAVGDSGAARTSISRATSTPRPSPRSTTRSPMASPAWRRSAPAAASSG